MRSPAAGSGAGEAGRSPQRSSQSPPQAQVEQQISRALDSVVDKLTGGSDAGARKLTDQLDRTRDMRERLNRLEQQVREAEAQQRAGGQRGGRQPQADGGQGGRQPQPSGRGSGGGGGTGEQLQQAREEYARELQRARESLGRMQEQQRGGGGATPEQHEFSRSAPGNEAFKQDFSRWETLRKDVDLALERYEAAVSDRLSRKGTEDRLNAGGSDRVPDKYRNLIAKYFQSLATGTRK
jgi:hypothetical protein